jgi:hypothetical protein
VRKEESPKRDLLSKNTDAMTKRSDEEDRGRRERGARGTTLGQKFALEGEEERKREAGRNEGQKGFPKAPYGAL